MPKQKEKKHTLSARQGWGYALLAMGYNMVIAFAPAYISIYYTDIVGVAVGTVGVILLVMKLTDGISDILMGLVIDRTHTKMGKARPWILAGGIGSAFSLYMLFNCPDHLSYMGKVIFCAVFYFLVNPFLGTVFGVAQTTIVNFFTGDSKERTSYGVVNTLGGLVTSILVVMIVPVLLSSLGESRETYRLIAGGLMVLTIICTAVSVLLVRESLTEKELERGNPAALPQQSVKESVVNLFKNKYFLYLAIGSIAYNIMMNAGSGIYYAKYILGDVVYQMVFTIPSLVVFLLLPLGLKLMARIGRRKYFTVCLACSVIGCTMVYFANDNFVWVAISFMIKTIGMLAFVTAITPTTGEISDYSLVQTGVPMDGMVFSGYSMGVKIGTGLGAAITNWILAWGGYVGTAEVQSDSALFAIRGSVSLFPAIMALIALFCFYEIDIEDHAQEIRAEIERRHLRG